MNENTNRELGVSALVNAMLDTMVRLKLDYSDALTVALTTYMYTVEATGEAMALGRCSNDDATAEQTLREELRDVSAMLEGLSRLPLKDWSAFLVACRAKAESSHAN